MWLDDLRQDTRFGLRTLRRSPAYALVVVATLALGIAANTTIFSLMNPYLFRPLPFSEPSELVQLGGVDPKEGWDGGRFSAPQIEDLVQRSNSFDELGHYYYSSVNHTGEQRAEIFTAGYMSGNLFRILGTPPALGRYLSPEDAAPGAPDVVVIGEELWEERWQSEPDILDRTMTLDGVAYAIVGVMPREFNFPFGGIHLWLASDEDALRSERSDMYVLPVGRLPSDQSAAAVSQDLDRALANMAPHYPKLDGRYSGVSVKPLREALNFAWSVLRLSFFLLLGAVGFVLLMACLNVASLTLARASSRSREVALRSAIGAHRSRLVRQLLTESFLLAVLGGLIGVGLAWAATRLLNGLLPDELFRVGDITLDGRVLAFSAALTLFTPLLFGVGPALAQARDAMLTLRSGAGAGTNRKTIRSRKVLVIAEVTLAIVLVTGTGLMIRSLQQATAVDVGFSHESLITAVVVPGEDRYPDAEALGGYFTQAKDRVLALPGIEAVGIASRIPLNHETSSIRYQLPQLSSEPFDDWPTAYYSRVDGDFFEAMGIDLLSGRVFDASDYQQAGSPVLISEGLAERLFPNGGAVGQTISYGSLEVQSGTILGVVGEVKYGNLQADGRTHLYLPIEGSAARRRFIVAASSGQPAAMAVPIEGAMRSIDVDLPTTTRPYSEVVKESLLLWSVSSLFLGVFGVVAVLLAALGIYGLMSFTVAERRREMGLRIALGAKGEQIQREVVWDGLKLAVVGLVLGVVFAIAGATAARSILFGVSALDPITLAGVAGLFALVTALAAALPARRAAKVDPLQVLRSE